MRGVGGERGQKKPVLPYQFFPRNFYKLRNYPPKNPFATLVESFKFVPRASPKLLNLNQDHTSKSGFSGQILIKLRL